MSLGAISRSISEGKVSPDNGGSLVYQITGMGKMMKKVQELCESTIPYEQNTHESERPIILAFGDSTCRGVGANKPSESLVGLIGGIFPEATIYNHGVIGATLESTIKQLIVFKQDFPDKKVDKIFLILGGNDITDNLMMSSDAFSQILGQKFYALLEAATRVSKNIFYVAPGNLGATFGLSGILGTETLRKIITNKTRILSILTELIGQEQGIHVSSNFRERREDPIGIDRGLAGYDEIHPSNEGYRLAFERLKDYL